MLFRSGFCRIQGNVCTVDPSRARFSERTGIENIDQKRFGIRAKLLCGTDCPTCLIRKSQIPLADIQQIDAEARHVILFAQLPEHFPVYFSSIYMNHLHHVTDLTDPNAAVKKVLEAVTEKIEKMMRFF